MGERTFDVVVFGATGFTGELVAEYLARRAPNGTRWALGGRNQGKLSALRERLQSERCPPQDVLFVDVSDVGSLVSMARSTRVVLSTVGPYALFGMPVVEAAIEGGADYVDITGEPAFVHEVIAKCDDRARERGVRIVNCCGFDSIPHDLGALFTAEQLPRGLPMSIEAYVRSHAGMSGGTWHSAINAMAGLRHARKGKGVRRRPSEGRKVRGLPQRIHFSKDVGAWAVPLPTIDPEVVLRSARELDVFGPDFRYGHYARMKTMRSVAMSVIGVGSIALLAQTKPTRALLEKVRPQGEGPSAEQRKKSWFEVTFVGTADHHRVVTTVSGGDPGYGETSKMISESALCLAHDRDALPARAGVLTTAVAMGTHLRKRLEEAGIRFAVKEQT
jgi:short subunit dehydrogenase-like uncharacterized protein